MAVGSSFFLYLFKKIIAFYGYKKRRDNLFFPFLLFGYEIRDPGYGIEKKIQDRSLVSNSDSGDKKFEGFPIWW
jgi:hypothetical protein